MVATGMGGWVGLKWRMGGGEEGVLNHHGDGWRVPILMVEM